MGTQNQTTTTTIMWWLLSASLSLTRNNLRLSPLNLTPFTFLPLSLSLSLLFLSSSLQLADPMKEIEFVSSASCTDPRILFKHQNLMQDYQELLKETEFKVRNLEMLRQKKLTLETEVRFLRGRYKHLKKDTTVATSSEMLRVSESRGLEVPSEPSGKRKKDFGSRALVPCFDLKQKKPLGDCGLEKKPKRSRGNEGLLNSGSLPDLNGDGNSFVADKVSGFDLNQISREEEERDVNGEHTVVEATENATLGNGNVNLHCEMKLPICRDVEKEINRAVKRKVTWQDPVALSV